MNDYNIKQLYEEMEMELISSMQRNLSRHLKEEDKVGFKFSQWQAEKLKELKRYQRQNASIIGKYTKGLNKKISKHMQEELLQGSKDAIKQYNKYNDDKKKINKTLNKSFFRTNDKKVNALINSVNNDLKTANTGALRMINDEYRQIIHKSAFFNANGIKTEQQAAAMATNEILDLKKIAMQSVDKASKSFLAGGLNCIEYSNGRRVNIASYSEMAVRTASLRAHLMGEGNFRKSIGNPLVQATSHGTACPICQVWEGHIFIDDVYSGGTKEDGNYTLLSEAMADGFLHPNCRHGLTTYYPELEGTSYDKEEEFNENEDIQNKINYYDRQEKKFDRLATGSIYPDNVKYYESKQEEVQNKINLLDLIKETRETISEEFQNRTKGVKIRLFNEKYSKFVEDENKIYVGTDTDKYLLIHELGHKLQSTFTKREKKLYNKIIKNKFSVYSYSDFKKIKSTVKDIDGNDIYYFRLKDYSKFVSKYQTRIYDWPTNFIKNKVNTDFALEYFSEGIMFYYKNPVLLKEKDFELYEFIKEIVEK